MGGLGLVKKIGPTFNADHTKPFLMFNVQIISIRRSTRLWIFRIDSPSTNDKAVGTSDEAVDVT